MAACAGHGLRGNAGHDMGMAHRHGFHPVRGNEYGRAVLRDAYQRRTILCCGSPGPSRMGSFSLMSAS